MAAVPFFPPRMPVAANTPKVCMVKGTAAGMEIQAQTAIRTAKSEMYIIVFVLCDAVCIRFLH